MGMHSFCQRPQSELLFVFWKSNQVLVSADPKAATTSILTVLTHLKTWYWKWGTILHQVHQNIWDKFWIKSLNCFWCTLHFFFPFRRIRRHFSFHQLYGSFAQRQLFYPAELRKAVKCHFRCKVQMSFYLSYKCFHCSYHNNNCSFIFSWLKHNCLCYQ